MENLRSEITQDVYMQADQTAKRDALNRFSGLRLVSYWPQPEARKVLHIARALSHLGGRGDEAVCENHKGFSLDSCLGPDMSWHLFADS
jgi:hypothetical protein